MRNRLISTWIVLAILLHLPPLLVYLPYQSVRAIGFIPYMLWINIPGIPLTMAGLPWYELKEFGAYPLNLAGWALIILFWILVAGGGALWFAWRRRTKERAKKGEGSAQ